MSFETDCKFTREALEQMLTEQAKSFYTASESPFLSGAPRPDAPKSNATPADREALAFAAKQLGLDPDALESHAATITDRPRARHRGGVNRPTGDK